MKLIFVYNNIEINQNNISKYFTTDKPSTSDISISSKRSPTRNKKDDKKDDKKDMNQFLSINADNEQDSYDSVDLILVQKIVEGSKLEKKELEKNLTSILRIASYRNADNSLKFPKLEEYLLKNYGMRGLPIKRFIAPDKRLNLYDHQIKAIIRILENENKSNLPTSFGMCGSIINLTQGLGKTLVALSASLMAPEIEKNGIKFPDLIVCSKSILSVWKASIEKFFDCNKIKILYYNKEYCENEEITRNDIINYNFVVVTYDTILVASKRKNSKGIEFWKETCDVSNGKVISIHTRKRYQSDDVSAIGLDVLFRTPWERVICDESQRFANPDTHIFRAMMSVYGKYKLCLSGTPIVNTGIDLWSQLRFCGYLKVCKKDAWSQMGPGVMKSSGLSSYIFRVDYNDTKIDLPPKYNSTYQIIPDKMGKYVYDFVIRKTRDVFIEMTYNNKMKYSCILSLFTRLRQICIAPYLITQGSKREHGSKVKEENVTTREYLYDIFNNNQLSDWIKDKNGTAGIKSPKIQCIIEILKKINKGNDKILIFSTFTSCLDLIGLAIDTEFGSSFLYSHIDGDTDTLTRESTIERFDNKEENIRCLLMTYKVGSEGLNLMSANHVICVEPWWTQACHDQAITRAWRTGQTKDVFVHNIYSANTIEERILEICESKKEISEAFLNDTRNKICPNINGIDVIKKKGGPDMETLSMILDL